MADLLRERRMKSPSDKDMEFLQGKFDLIPMGKERKSAARKYWPIREDIGEYCIIHDISSTIVARKLGCSQPYIGFCEKLFKKKINNKVEYLSEFGVAKHMAKKKNQLFVTNTEMPAIHTTKVDNDILSSSELRKKVEDLEFKLGIIELTIDGLEEEFNKSIEKINGTKELVQNGELPETWIEEIQTKEKIIEKQLEIIKLIKKEVKL